MNTIPMNSVTRTELPRLNTLPAELLYLIFQWLPAETAYFVRFVCRALRGTAAHRVEKALAAMIAAEEPYAVVDFLNNITQLAEKASGSRVRRSVESVGGLLACAGLRPGAVCYEILDLCSIGPTSERNGCRGKLLCRLGASKAEVRLALEHFCLANQADEDREAEGDEFANCLLHCGLSRADAIEVALSLRRTDFSRRWIMVHDIMLKMEDEGAYNEGESMVSSFAQRLLVDVVKKGLLKADIRLREMLTPVISRFRLHAIPDVFEHLETILDWKLRGTLLWSVVDAEDADLRENNRWDEVYDTAISLLRATTSTEDFWGFFENCDMDMALFTPYLLDGDRWPSDHPVQVLRFTEDALKDFRFHFPWLSGDEFSNAKHNSALRWAKSTIRAILAYGRLDLRRICAFILKTRISLPWAEACVAELATPGPLEQIRSGKVMVILLGSDMPSWSLAYVLSKRLDEGGRRTVTRGMFLPHLRNQNGELVAHKVAQLTVQAVLGTPDQDTAKPIQMPVWRRGGLLLDKMLDGLRPGTLLQSEVLKRIPFESWEGFLGEVVVAILSELSNYANRATLRNLGQILGSIPDEESYSIAQIPLWQVRGLTELLGSDEDVLEFASGVVHREPGSQAFAAVEEVHRRCDGTIFEEGYLSDLLETLLGLHDDFGQVPDWDNEPTTRALLVPAPLD